MNGTFEANTWVNIIFCLWLKAFGVQGSGVFFMQTLEKKENKYLRDILTVMVPHKIQS